MRTNGAIGKSEVQIEAISIESAAAKVETDKKLGRAPVWIWALLAAATVGVSCAGAVFQHLDDIPPLLRASWRLQVCDLF